jgi:sugar lactone lactonase YvrE
MPAFRALRLACLALGLAPLVACSSPSPVKGGQDVEKAVTPRGYFSAEPTVRPVITPMPLPRESEGSSATPAPQASQDAQATTPASTETATPGPTPTPTPVPTPRPPSDVRSIAGGSPPGDANGAGGVARFNDPSGVALQPDGALIVADALSHQIRKLTLADGKATVATLTGAREPGYLDGFASRALFATPRGVAIAPDGAIFVADAGNHAIRRIVKDGAGDVMVSTVAGGAGPGLTDGEGKAARFKEPFGVTVAADGVIYVADTGNHVIRKLVMNGEKAMVTTLSGNGEAGKVDGKLGAARFNGPRGVVAVQVAGHTRLLIADTENHALRVLDGDDVSTLAGNGAAGFGDGAGNAALFERPWGLAADLYDPTRPVVYLADWANHRICRVEADGTVQPLAGSGEQGTVDGQGEAANLRLPAGLALDASDREHPKLWVTDGGNHLVRRLQQP